MAGRPHPIRPVVPLGDAAWLLWRHWRELGSLANPWRPRRFNDWLFRRLILAPHPLDAQLCCKLGQRAFKDARIGAAASPPLLGVWDDAAALDHAWEGLPERFMLKPTHGSGWYRAVRDKAAADRRAILAEAAGWLRQSYWRVSREIGYREVVPRLIAEPLLAPAPGLAAPREYGLFCFDGRVALAMCRANTTGGEKRLAFFDAEGRRLALGKPGRVADPAPSPDRAAWERMCALSATLSAGVDFLRCDFLLEGATVWASELTPCPDGGRMVLAPAAWSLWLGEAWAATRDGRPWPEPPAGAAEG